MNGNIIVICTTAKCRDKPDTVHFLTINFPELSNNMIAKLISTTNCTVEQIRDGSHHNMKNIIPRDPVLIDLYRQEDLNAEVEKVKVEKEKQERLKNIKIATKDFRVIYFIFC
ncbi:MAG: cell cycle transcriptional regulator TrcR [Wolbachia sp.]